MMDEEIWKAVDGYQNHYTVSDRWHVLRREWTHKTYGTMTKILKTYMRGGSLCVRLADLDVYRGCSRFRHRLPPCRRLLKD
jgi:hypothetical protein